MSIWWFIGGTCSAAGTCFACLPFAVYTLLPAVALGCAQVHELNLVQETFLLRTFADLHADLGHQVAMSAGGDTQGPEVAECTYVLWHLFAFLFYLAKYCDLVMVALSFSTFTGLLADLGYVVAMSADRGRVGS